MQDEPLPPEAAPKLEDIDPSPTVIPPVKGDVEVTLKEYADALAEVGEDRDTLKAQIEAETARILNDLIRPSSDKAFRFMWCYCSAVLALLLLHGFHVCGFSLPDDTLAYLVGSTAATVIGLVGMVLTGIFIGARK